MRKTKFVYGLLFTGCLSVVWPSDQSFAAVQSVKVTLPTFQVQLNGHHVENQNREYPLLVYNDITYFPMTWYDARLLGLETVWTPQKGLSVTKGKVTSSYRPYATNHTNPTVGRATIPDYAMTINGVAVDNSKEEYPLLSFQDIIYFPLTWHFAHDEFGWDYAWNDAKGLSITSKNLQLQTVNLPASAGENDVAVFKGYYYFVKTEGETNRVYRVPVEDPSKEELVYAYERDTSYGKNESLTFQIRDQELWFSYHRGGATMGSDAYCLIHEDGKATLEQKGYLDFKKLPNGTLYIQQGVPPGGGNLRVLLPGAKYQDGQQVGDDRHIYGWHITANDSGASYKGDRSTTVIGDDVYVMGSSFPADSQDVNQIHRIHLPTNESVKIVSEAVRQFKIINNRLFYIKDVDHSLYAAHVDGKNEQKLSDNQVADWFDEIDGTVYYTAANASGQLHVYRAEPSGDDELFVADPVESVQLVNGKIIAKLAADEAYGLKIWDRTGQLYTAVADQISDVFAYEDAIILTTAEDKKIQIIK
ncbi:DUF5050 domain-containing protein [Paenibacillus sp. HWE-109]|uniref:DUF5050 domain-containing protein n=1 Tax=Paenibacillus sp. HWE-109 TaxID=1306526 RepID=UPI001EDDA3C4|nr:DUF5050 domain-containing protein [Paenibacillus sp. HWE-109]UKS25427.1 DUF5050 domain-containing protein [Paenibacillus sp. HWE-109]